MEFKQQWDSQASETDRANTRIDFAGDPGCTKQAPKDDTDINVIIRRFGITDGSQLPYWTNPRAIYADISEFPQDPTELANIMRDAEIRFMALPADIRSRFPTPGALFAFANDPKNTEEAIKLGILRRDTKEVSLSTSSVKEPLVQTTNSDTEGKAS